jgi:hypothetical protein
MDKIAKADYKFVPINPEPGFSPVRNKMIIDKTIEKYEKRRKKAVKNFQDTAAERIDVIATWLTSMKGSNKPIDKYISRQYMSKLVGEKIMAKLDMLKKFHNEHPNIIT